MINRRRFIQQTAAGVAGLTISQYAFSNILLQKKEKLGVALVGLGYYSTDLIAPALQLTQKCSLTGIVTGSPEKAEKWKQQYNIPDKNVYNYQNFDSIANNPDIDVVYVILPPSMHAEYTIRAAKAGKHVWCEKPMAMTEAECKSMIDACKKNKVTLAIGYRLHHEPNTQRIIQIRKDMVYGKVLDAVIPNQQAKQMDDDAVAIMNKKPLLVPGEEGLKDIKVVEAIYKSVAQNGRVKIS